MTETAVPQAPPITCPSWCAIGPNKHAEEQCEFSNCVLHRSTEADDQPLAAAALELETSPDGTPLSNATPRIYLNEAATVIDGLLPSDARYLAEQILAAVEAAQA